MWTMLSPKGVQNNHMAAPDKSTNHLRTFRTLPPVPTPAHTGTLRNLPPEPTIAHARTLRNLPPEPTIAHARTLRNLPALTSRTYTSTHRNSPEPAGTCLQNLHQHTPELSGTTSTHRNSPEPTSAHIGTLRNLPEPASGTCSCDPHRNTPELIWAEDPFSLRCWGKIGPGLSFVRFGGFALFVICSVGSVREAAGVRQGNRQGAHINIWENIGRTSLWGHRRWKNISRNKYCWVIPMVFFCQK